MELTILWTGLTGVFRKSPEGGFTMHQTPGWIPIAAALILVSPAELILVHLLAERMGGPWIAWILTAGTLYSLLWLWGDAQGMRLNPTTLDDDRLNLRVGLRWQATIPLEDIVGIEDSAESDLQAVVMGEPDFTLVLRRPVTVRGPFGITRETDRIALQMDDRAAFESTVTSGTER